jgi:glutaredoxin
MKKILGIFILSLFVLTGCNKESTSFDDNKAYLFYSQTCPHCHQAREYMNKKYPNADIIQLDVATENGRELLLACANKFKLTDHLGVPLICLGNRNIMGWSSDSEKKFDRYIRPFLKK